MDTLDRTWQCTEPLLGPAIHKLKPNTAKRTKGSFSPTSSFTLVNLWWSHAEIKIPYPALFPLPIPHPNSIKTRNPAPTSNWNSRFPPLFSAQIPNITAKKSQIPHPAKPIGYPLSNPNLQRLFDSFSSENHASIDDEISQFNQVINSVAKSCLAASRKTSKYQRKETMVRSHLQTIKETTATISKEN